MDKKAKEQKLRDFAQALIDNPSQKDMIQALLRKFGLTREELTQGYVDYDLDVLGYDNSIYEPIVMRFVLYLHSLLPGSWHQERQDTVLEYLEKAGFESAIDIGFGSPTRYLFHYLRHDGSKSFTLTDIYDSAFEFSAALLDAADNAWQGRVSFLKDNMDDMKYPGNHDVYIFQDSIEHTKNPTGYLRMIAESSPADSLFIFSLPVCPLVPSHHIEFKSKAIAEKWLNDAGLEIIEAKEISINPEVDLFAAELDNDVFNFAVLCKKTAQ